MLNGRILYDTICSTLNMTSYLVSSVTRVQLMVFLLVFLRIRLMIFRFIRMAFRSISFLTFSLRWLLIVLLEYMQLSPGYFLITMFFWGHRGIFQWHHYTFIDQWQMYRIAIQGQGKLLQTDLPILNHRLKYFEIISDRNHL